MSTSVSTASAEKLGEQHAVAGERNRLRRIHVQLAQAVRPDRGERVHLRAELAQRL
jgi:hypothetical protein